MRSLKCFPAYREPSIGAGTASSAALVTTGILRMSLDLFEPSSEAFITYRPKILQRYIKGR